MSFLKSTVNQVGRDLGKVISNQIFKDNHSTPYRKVVNDYGYNRKSLSSYKSDFEKVISFQMVHRPSTLIAKVSGVYTVIKNEANIFISDGYLDVSESNELFYMMNQFNNKVDDICDILEIDEEANKKEINQLLVLINKANNLFSNVLKVSADGCVQRQKDHEIEASNIEEVTFLKYLALNIIWMGGYARGGEKSIFNMVLANIIDLITMTFPLTRTYLFFKGLFTFSSEKRRRKMLKNAYIKLAQLEGKRAEAYLAVSN